MNMDTAILDRLKQLAAEGSDFRDFTLAVRDEGDGIITSLTMSDGSKVVIDRAHDDAVRISACVQLQENDP